MAKLTSTKVHNNIDDGLWIYDGRNEVYADYVPADFDRDGGYTLSYGDGLMPVHHTDTYETEAELIDAMRKIAPLRNWRINYGE